MYTYRVDSFADCTPPSAKRAASGGKHKLIDIDFSKDTQKEQPNNSSKKSSSEQLVGSNWLSDESSDDEETKPGKVLVIWAALH